MGVSVTRYVKFIRKGKGVIVAQSRNVYNYTYKEWTQFYGLSGRTVNWDGIINVSDFSVGDTMVINGTVSDKQRITISLYSRVTAIDTNRAIITAQSLYYIASGENGEDGNDGVDAITIDITPPIILHKKTAANTSYAVTIKVFEGTKQLISSNGSGSSFKCNVDTSNFPTGLKGNTVADTNVYTLILVVEANSNPSKDIAISIVCRGVTHKRTVSFKTVADGQPGAKGDRGPALRGPQAWSDCAVGYMFQSGASGEEYKDVVLYGNNYYSCIKSHTKTGKETGANNTLSTDYWKLADKLEIVATKILLAQYALVKNLGVEAIDMKDADDNIIFQAKDGEVTCNKGTFNSITVKGNSTFEGSVKANMFYGTVKKVTPGSTYTIDPVNEPYNFYYVENPTKRTFIVLPKAANYEGLEINIFTKSLPSSSLIYRTIVKAQANDDLYVKQNAAVVSSDLAVEKINVGYTNFKNDSVTTATDSYIRFKCIGGAWYAISGQFTGE
ncbi:hypothetical protein [Segatella sp.]|uniref:hypothetical protein n=1 Tax=Segatella sp. TaxID=2974253 RepID=UPI003AB7D0C9